MSIPNVRSFKISFYQIKHSRTTIGKNTTAKIRIIFETKASLS